MKKKLGKNVVRLPVPSAAAKLARRKGAIGNEISATLSYERGCKFLDEAARIDQVKDIREKVEALRLYQSRRADQDRRLIAVLSAIRTRADYEIGLRSKALAKETHAGPGRGKTSSAERKSFPEGKLAILKQAGIPFQRAAEYEAFTEIISPKAVDKLIIAAVDKYEAIKSTKAFILQQRDDEIAARFHAIKSELTPQLHVGDFREKASVIADASVDLVFTDPPYDRESIPLYEAAAKEAARILKPGGSMISYCGHLLIPEVLPLMMAHLKYFWMGAHVHDGGPMSRMTQFGIIAGFKPLLWFVKDKRAERQNFLCDTVLAKQEKDSHPWQQDVAVAEHFIQGLTSEGGMVVDFFAGGGTTIIAAQKLNRLWQAFEIDEKAVVAIKDRMEVVR